jgi:hypothetical protein
MIAIVVVMNEDDRCFLMIDLFSEINMANIQSLPIQPQQQHRSTSQINGNNFYFHFG